MNMKKFILILSAFYFYVPYTIAMQVDKSNLNDTIKSKPEKNQEGDASLQQEANVKILKLYRSFGERISSSGYKTYKYPPHFGGAHILKNGKLVISISGDFKIGKKKIENVIGSGNTDFQSVKYSYAYLENLMDELNLFLMENSKTLPALDPISNYATRGATNSIEVGIIDLNDEKISALKNTPFNNPAIIFKNSGSNFNQLQEHPPAHAAAAIKTKNLHILNIRPFKFVKLDITPKKYSKADTTKGKIKMYSNSRKIPSISGNYVHIEKWENGIWVSKNRKAVAVEDIATYLNKVESLEQEFTLDKYLLKEEMKPGKYRVLKSFSLKYPTRKNVVLSTIFWIVD